jgi:hypothetical protein
MVLVCSGMLLYVVRSQEPLYPFQYTIEYVICREKDILYMSKTGEL